MLLNKIAETRKTIEEYKQLNSEFQKVRIINTFAQTTKVELNKIKATLASYHALHQMDPEVFPKKKFSHELKQLESLMDNGLEEYNNDLINGFSRLFQRLDEDLKMKWSVYVRSKNQDIIGLLERLQNIVTNQQEIKQLITELRRFENKWPVTSINLDRYHEHLNNANKLVSEINASKGVQEFISKVAANHATLDDLTDEVISWLRTKQLTNKLVIKFK